jgi:hypothetical protein
MTITYAINPCFGNVTPIIVILFKKFSTILRKIQFGKVLQNLGRKIQGTPKLSIPKWELNLGIM